MRKIEISHGRLSHGPDIRGIAAGLPASGPRYDFPAVAKLEKLSRDEKRRKAECEGKIAVWEEYSIEASAAIKMIRDERLYRDEYATWDEYCEKRWSWSARHGHRQCKAAEIIQNLLTTGLPDQGTKGPESDQLVAKGTTDDQTKGPQIQLPTNESQLRALSGLEPEEQRRVWAAVLEECRSSRKEPTATHIIAVRARVVGGGVPEYDLGGGEEIADSQSPIAKGKQQDPKGEKRGPEVEADFLAACLGLQGCRETVRISLLEERFRWTYNRALEVFDLLVERNRLRDGKFVSAPESKSEEAFPGGPQAIEFNHALAKGTIRFTKGSAGWLWAWGYSYAVGSKQSRRADFDPTDGAVPTREGAIRMGATALRESALVVLRGPTTPGKQKRIAKMLVEWCNTQIREAGATRTSEEGIADSQSQIVEVERTEVAEPELQLEGEKVEEEAGIREVLRLAVDEKLSWLAKKALEQLRPLQSVLEAREFPTVIYDQFGQARYFMGCIESELQRIVKEGFRGKQKEESGEQKTEKPQKSTKGAKRRSANRRQQVENRKITMAAKSAHSKKSTGGTKATRAMDAQEDWFVALAFNANSTLAKKPFYAGRGKWTSDLKEAMRGETSAAGNRMLAGIKVPGKGVVVELRTIEEAQRITKMYKRQ